MLRNLGLANETRKRRLKLGVSGDTPSVQRQEAAFAALDSGDASAALRLFADSLAAAREEACPAMVSTNLLLLGHLHETAGRSGDALAAYQQGVAGCHAELAEEMEKGLMEAAKALTADCFETIEDTLQGRPEAGLLPQLNKALAQANQRPPEEAFLALEGLLEQARRLGDPRAEILILLARCSVSWREVRSPPPRPP